MRLPLDRRQGYVGGTRPHPCGAGLIPSLLIGLGG